MKKLLQFPTGIVLLLLSVSAASGQTSILAENFSGFMSGSHTTPSTSDVSASLDSKTAVPGWTGSMIYPAGGEIKVGTSANTGWIETPAIDLSVNSGNYKIEFDISRWTGDATTVQVYLNGSVIGSVITPTDNFQKIQIHGTGGKVSSKIKIQALTKRFYLDNFSINTDSISTDIYEYAWSDEHVRVFPVPANNKLTIGNIRSFNLIEIYDITGRLIMSSVINGSMEIVLDVASYKSGIYIIILRSDRVTQELKFIKI